MIVAQGLFDDRKDCFPVIFHTDDVPPTGRCFVERFVESSDMRVAVIGKLVGNEFLEFLGRRASMGGHRHFHQRAFAARHRGRPVAL